MEKRLKILMKMFRISNQDLAMLLSVDVSLVSDYSNAWEPPQIRSNFNAWEPSIGTRYSCIEDIMNYSE